MGATDTVVYCQPHGQSVVCPYCNGEFGVEDMIDFQREAQAEISFKAGIREVVEWLNDYVPMFCRDDKKWQAKLKEWGIEM